MSFFHTLLVFAVNIFYQCNLRASRSFPFVSKTLNIDFIELATKVVLGVPYKSPEIPRLDYVGVKVPQFSFIRLKGADPVLGVEMASTGEVACFGKTKGEAYIKGLLATGFKLPKQNILLSIGSFKEKHEFLPSAKRLVEAGYTLFGTPGTADFMHENGVKIQVLFLTYDSIFVLSYSFIRFWTGTQIIIPIPTRPLVASPSISWDKPLICSSTSPPRTNSEDLLLS